MNSITNTRLREIAQLYADAGVEGVYEALYAVRYEMGGHPPPAEDASAIKIPILIEVDVRTAAYLRSLTRSTAVPKGTLNGVIQHLAQSAADGVRRPGAWERGWLRQAFGDFPVGPQTEDVPYAHREPWTPEDETH